MNQGISGINTNPYLGLNGYSNMGDLASNPYFLAAFNSPNYNQMQANQSIMNQQNSLQQPQADTFTPSTQNNVSFEGKSDTIPPTKNGNGTAWAILGTGLTVGAAILGHKAYKLGPEGATFFNRLSKGASTMWDNMCSSGKNLKGKLTNSGKNKTQFSVSNINGQEVYTLPNTEARTVLAKYTDDLNNLGITIPKFNETNATINTFSGNKIEIGDAICDIVYEDGKIVKLLDGSGKDILSKYVAPTNDAEKAFANHVKEYLGKVLKKDSAVTSNLNIVYSVADNDLTYLYKQTANEIASLGVTTHRYSANSNEVLQYLGKNKNADEAIQALRKNDPSKLKVATATYKDGGVTYHINNGKIESIDIQADVLENTAAGTYKIGTPAFDAYAYRHQEFMKNVLERKNDWSNVIYHLA